jgi:hypothetical protein
MFISWNHIYFPEKKFGLYKETLLCFLLFNFPVLLLILLTVSSANVEAEHKQQCSKKQVKEHLDSCLYNQLFCSQRISRYGKESKNVR